MTFNAIYTKTAIYARISTKDKHQNLNTQIDSLKRILPEGQECVEYTDKITGSDFNRPGLDELMKDCKAGKIKKIYVTELSRIGRSLINLENIMNKFQAWGVDLVIMDVGVDTSTPAGRLFFQIAGAFAEYERELIRERVIRGMDRARAEGKDIGRPERRISEETLADVHDMRELGITWRDIEGQTGIPKSTLQRKYKMSQKGGGKSHD